MEPRKGIAPLAALAAASILIFIAAVAAVALVTSSGRLLGGSPASTTAPVYANATGNTLLNEYPQGAQLNATQLANTLVQQLNASGQLNVSYSGSAVISGFGILVDGLTISIPLNITYQKYGNSSRLDLLADTPLGAINYDVIEINQSVSYTCRGGLGILNGSSGSSNYTCARSNASFLAAASSPASLSGVLASLPGLSNSTALKSLGARSYDNMACALVSTVGYVPTNETLPLVGSISGLSYNASSCISSAYYVPLNVTAALYASLSKGGNGKVVVSLKEISIGMPVTRSEVVSLPAPVAASEP